MSHRSAAATEAARRLWDGNAAEVSVPEEVAVAAERVCAQLRSGLGRWVGPEGYRALLTRALEQERAEHPVLSNLSCQSDGNLEIAAAVRAHGTAGVAAAIVALVATLIDLLGHIIGEEMAVELVTQTGAVSLGRPTTTEPEGERNG